MRDTLSPSRTIFVSKYAPIALRSVLNFSDGLADIEIKEKTNEIKNQFEESKIEMILLIIFKLNEMLDAP